MACWFGALPMSVHHNSAHHPSAHLQDVVQLLESIDLFKGISHQDLSFLAQRVAIHHYRAGEIIFNYGEIGSVLYIVVSGQVNIYLPGEASHRISLKDIARGEYFGELALFDNQPRSASTFATTDVEVLELTQATLLYFVERHPHIAIALLQTLSHRLRATDMLLSQRASKNAELEYDSRLTWRDRIADKVAELNGSWMFILFLLSITLGWMFLNSNHVLGSPFDPYPYVFFNLLLAVIVSLQGPLIVMSQNRQALKDRTHAKIDYEINLKNEVNIETLLRELGEFRMETHQRLSRLEASDAEKTDRLES
jgi:CRP/FNR family transcriptional regulator, cyclic AMP receptor protein